jgi:hypothetical protein
VQTRPASHPVTTTDQLPHAFDYLGIIRDQLPMNSNLAYRAEFDHWHFTARPEESNRTRWNQS